MYEIEKYYLFFQNATVNNCNYGSLGRGIPELSQMMYQITINPNKGNRINQTQTLYLSLEPSHVPGQPEPLINKG